MSQGLPEFGRSLDSSIIERGLRELCPDLHFDLAAAIGQIHPYIEFRQGVWYNGKHICSMDRGQVPEFKLWSVFTNMEEVGWYRADEEGVTVRFEQVLPSEPNYQDLRESALKGSDPSLAITMRGQVQRRRCFAAFKRPGRILRLGWRHTFEKILNFKVPGVTRRSLESKFGVNMYMFPVGPPDEVIASIVTE